MIHVTHEFFFSYDGRKNTGSIEEITIRDFSVFEIAIEIIIGLVIPEEIPIITTWPKGW